MNSDRPADYLASQLHELRALPQETEWVEFKVNEAGTRIRCYASFLGGSARTREEIA